MPLKVLWKKTFENNWHFEKLQLLLQYILTSNALQENTNKRQNFCLLKAEMDVGR